VGSNLEPITVAI